MDEKQTKVSKFLSGLLPQLQVKPVVDQSQVAATAGIVFITAVLIILAWFAVQKSLK